MKLKFALLLLIAPFSLAENPRVVLTLVRGHVYVVEDYFYLRENSIVYLGDDSVAVVGATWTPETAKLLVNEINKITSKPISEVIDTNYHPDRAGGNAYFRSIGAKIVSTKMTSDLLTQHWDEMVRYVQKGFPNYPTLPLVAPDKTVAGDFELQNGGLKAIYLGPSHTSDGIFVFFPQEKVLYGNCILKEQLGNLDFADLTEYPKTLEKLKQLNLGFTTTIAGHWSAIHGPELIDQYLQLLAAKSR
jgi:metallo-beta-lactamase class B